MDLTRQNTLTTHWYCIQTKRFKEGWVIRQLKGTCPDVFLPLLRQQRRVRRQLKWVIEPLFPGYLFAYFSAQESYRRVRYTPGVLNVVSTCEGEPIEVDPGLIRPLQERCCDGYIELAPSPFRPGEEVEVTDGPFQGLRALFEKDLKAGERVAVLLDLLSSQVRVELPRAYVKKVEAGAGYRSAP